jgi:multiple sugar transport system permease protein
MTTKFGRAAWSDYLFVVPALLFVVAFLLLPVLFVIGTSLTDWDLLHPMRFVGLANYVQLFRDPTLLGSTRNTLLWVVLVLLFPMLFGLLLAVFLKNVWLSRQLKSIFYIPLAMSGAGTGIIWRWIFSRTGLLNAAFAGLGIIDKPISWLLYAPGNTLTMVAASTWQITGINMVLFLMGLQNIPTEVLEAAKIDGASEWKTFTRIIMPLLRPIVTLVVLMNIIGSFKVFDIIWTMTSGGPARSSETLAVSMYNESFGLFHMGYGAAIAFVLSAIVFVVGIFYMRIIGKER